jgi:hypothetical protein
MLEVLFCQSVIISPFHNYYESSFQQIVDANVDYNAREGRSTAEVSCFIQPSLIAEL